VNYDETLPFYFAEFMPQYTPYNYGFHGYGPQQMLSKLQAAGIQSEIREKRGILIYTYIPSHVPRAIGSMESISWGSNTPFYTIDAKGFLVRKGSFESSRPFITLLYSVLGRSAILKYFRIDFPVIINKYHYRLTTRIIAESRKIFRETFISEGFYVIVYPNKLSGKGIKAYLKNAGIIYFDYSDLFDHKSEEYYIEGDGHPSPMAYKAITAKFAKDTLEADSSRRR